MTFIVSLGTFCERHGYKVIMCTQQDEAGLSKHSRTRESPIPSRSYRESFEDLAVSPKVCEACEFKVPGSAAKETGTSAVLVTRSKESKHAYASRQAPQSEYTEKCLDQITVSAFTIEAGAGADGMHVFGDGRMGYTIARLFYIHDSKARGGQRKYVMFVTCDDESLLFANYRKIHAGLVGITDYLGGKVERKQTSFADLFLKTTVESPRLTSLASILNDERLFVRLHLWACSLLDELCH